MPCVHSLATMLPGPRSYDVHGLRMNVRVESDSMVAPLDALLHPFAAGDAGQAPVRLLVRYDDLDSHSGTPPGMRPFWKGVLPGGMYLEYYTGEGVRQVEQPGRTRLHLDLERRLAKAWVRPGEEWSLGFGCLIPVLCEFLPQAGHHVVHCAVLRAEGEGGSAAVLVSGPSGAGKTTAALALAGAGMGLVTDDAGVLTAPAGGPQEAVRAWGLPRPCKVHLRTLALLPWLRGLPRRPSRSEDEFLLAPGDIAPTDPKDELPVRLLLLLDERNGEGHRLTPIDALTAITRLTRENVRAPDSSADGPAGRAFGVLARLVGQCPAYSISIGPDIEGLHAAVDPLLGSRVPS